MKKAAKITLGVVGGIIIISAIASSANPNSSTVPNSNSDTPQQSTSQQPQPTEKMTIANSVYQDSDGFKQVVGEVTNKDTKTHSATLKATFYDATGKIMGTAVGTVNEVAPNQTKTFNLMTTDSVEGYKELKVQIDTLL